MAKANRKSYDRRAWKIETAMGADDPAQGARLRREFQDANVQKAVGIKCLMCMDPASEHDIYGCRKCGEPCGSKVETRDANDRAARREADIAAGREPYPVGYDDGTLDPSDPRFDPTASG